MFLTGLAGCGWSNKERFCCSSTTLGIGKFAKVNSDIFEFCLAFSLVIGY